MGLYEVARWSEADLLALTRLLANGETGSNPGSSTNAFAGQPGGLMTWTLTEIAIVLVMAWLWLRWYEWRYGGTGDET